ncbi:MAG: bifunctional phosphopantothenoylcysteine decarboxylase/phosphopantothenate--cysteine ligase CoaBC [Deltaproteobacteria bacterium]|nr:bifunctional phosphopantothenoylcysteine decarboxylase/phosphopantothenate--cysteine ligase CoaBC [Deltaproteobacteria bacterium]
MKEKKNIVLGITGGIAAYKSAELARELVKRGDTVTVIMTENAEKFISSLTLQALTGNQVHTDMFSPIGEWEIGHISLARSADIMVVAPATANILGKIAAGLADDLLSTTIMATEAPVLLCPAMNSRMYTNPIVTENMKKLVSLGYFILDARSGMMACGTEGPGRLPPVEAIIEEIDSIVTPGDLSGERVLVTAGPTREAMDPVRYISNHSSGKMGYAIAAEAKKRGASVILVSGPTDLEVPGGVTCVNVMSAEEMRTAVLAHVRDSSVIIKAAAVSDYRPSVVSEQKIKKGKDTLTLQLERNPDIIAEVGKEKGDRILVGFAMETEQLEKNARKKLKEKNMDFIVANDLGTEGAGFRYDTNIVKIIHRRGAVEALPIMTKREVAGAILDRVKKLLDERRKDGPER